MTSRTSKGRIFFNFFKNFFNTEKCFQEKFLRNFFIAKCFKKSLLFNLLCFWPGEKNCLKEVFYMYIFIELFLKLSYIM